MGGRTGVASFYIILLLSGQLVACTRDTFLLPSASVMLGIPGLSVSIGGGHVTSGSGAGGTEATASVLTADQCTCLQAKAKSDSFGAFLAAAALVGAVALHGPGSSEATNILSNQEAVALLSKYASVKALLQDHAAWQAETAKACSIKMTGGSKSTAEIALGILNLDEATLCPAGQTSGRNLLWSGSWLKDGLTIAAAFGVGVLESYGGTVFATSVGVSAAVFVTGLTIWTGPMAPAIGAAAGAAVGAAVACGVGILVGEGFGKANEKIIEEYIDDPDVREVAKAAATVGQLVNIGYGVRKAYKARKPLERLFDNVKDRFKQVKSQRQALQRIEQIDAGNSNRIGKAKSNVKGAEESLKRYMTETVGSLGSDAYDVADKAGKAAGEAVLGQSVTRPAGDAAGSAGQSVNRPAGDASGSAGQSVTRPAGDASGTAKSACAEVAGKYAVSADRWVPARSTEPCPKWTSFEIFANCDAIQTNSIGKQIKARYTPGSPNAWAGMLMVERDWRGNTGAGDNMKDAYKPRSLGVECFDSETNERLGEWLYHVPSWKQGIDKPVATTASQPAPSADTYTVDGTAYTLCTRPLNMPVGGGMGVRMVGTDDCVNCGAYPCPQKMTCKPGKASPTQAPEIAFATCV